MPKKSQINEYSDLLGLSNLLGPDELLVYSLTCDFSATSSSLWLHVQIVDA
jgi:hypothetical protein